MIATIGTETTRAATAMISVWRAVAPVAAISGPTRRS